MAKYLKLIKTLFNGCWGKVGLLLYKFGVQIGNTTSLNKGIMCCDLIIPSRNSFEASKWTKGAW